MHNLQTETNHYNRVLQTCLHLQTCIVLHGHFSHGKTNGPAMKAVGGKVLL